MRERNNNFWGREINGVEVEGKAVIMLIKNYFKNLAELVFTRHDSPIDQSDEEQSQEYQLRDVGM